MSGWSNNDLMMMASYGEYDAAFSVIVALLFVGVVRPALSEQRTVDVFVLTT